MLKIFPSDRITGCEPPQPEDPPVCLFCSANVFRVAVILREDESRTFRLLLCREHYAEAREADPELVRFEDGDRVIG